MKKSEIVAKINKEKLVAIVRTKSQEDVAAVLKTIITAGVKVLEITSNTAGYLEEISKARLKYPDVLVGAGTVINSDIAKKAIDSGAQFLVTPNTDVNVIKTAHEHDIPVLMGALTPSEVCMAKEHGADIVKLFPAGNMGISYFKSLKGPLDQFEYYAVGGIKTDNVLDWLNAGASGIGYGCIVKDKLSGEIDLKATRAEAELILKKIQSFNHS